MTMTADTDDVNKFFDEWSELAKSDPERFEEERKRILAGFVAQAGEQHKERLTRLQWRIDQERARAKNPIASMIRLNQMMMDRVYNEGGFQDVLSEGSRSIKAEVALMLRPESRKPPVLALV